MENLDIRQELLRANVKQWKVAESLGISESQFSKMLRREVPDEKKEKILETIRVLSIS